MTMHVDERMELQISRYLDGALSPAERGELEQALRSDAAARALFDEYASNDAAALEALRTVVVSSPRPSRFARPRIIRLWGSVAGVMAAAAAVALFVFPYQPHTAPRVQPGAALPLVSVPPPDSTIGTESPRFVVDEGLTPGDMERRLMPRQSYVNTQRNWIVVFDPATQRHFLVQVDQQARRSQPVFHNH